MAFALDFGTGAFANMRRYADYERLDAVVISHMHADHFLDLIPLRYAVRYGTKRRTNRLPIWLPPGGEAVLRTIAGAFANEGNGDFLNEAFELHEFDPNGSVPMGSGELRFAATTHYIPSYAVRFERGDASVTYSADTAPDPRVIDLAHRTDLFLCEATLLAEEIEGGGVRGHSSSLEAAQMAAEASARRLALTHYSQEATFKDLEQSARQVYGGEIDVVDDHYILTVG